MSSSSMVVTEETWNAIVGRDRRFDGHFVYAVTGTGIYCRPTCPARRPKRQSVKIFGSSDEAERAGFRACKRCTPQHVTRQQHAIAHIQQLLETEVPTPTLGELGDAVGLTPSHVQRLFKRSTGLSPHQYARALKAERLQQRLREGQSVAEAQYEAGYGSSHALYRSIDLGLGTTPGRYRRGGAGERIHYGFGETVQGPVLLAATASGVCSLRFGGREQTTAELRQEFYNAELLEDQAQVGPYLQAVRDHLLYLREDLHLPLDIEATDFQCRVWTALRQIPIGETRSYGDVAIAIGKPTAVRAVARACASNPVALVIPCHRIVRSTGELSGYRWGVARKRELLAREAEAKRELQAREAEAI